MAVKGRDNSLVTNHDYNDGRVPRTLCKREFNWRSTFNSGFLIPLWCDECYPSEVKTVDLGMLLRSITPLGPTMDNSFLDVYFFFVPNRILWDHWEEFIAGYNKEAWTQGTIYETPMIKFKTDLEMDSESDNWDNPKYVNKYIHSFLDYMPGACDVIALSRAQYGADYDGGPVEESRLAKVFGISSLYPRAYVKIWNTYFRDQNLQDEYDLYTGDNDEYADEFTSFNLLDPTKLPKAAKLKNRFTTAWPQPQKGPDVLIPMTNLPVSAVVPEGITLNNNQYLSGAGIWNKTGSTVTAGVDLPLGVLTTSAGAISKVSQGYANNVSNTIRQLRVAVQTEKFLAKDAKGTRYNESLITHFGQHSSMARLDMPEYLGSRQIPLNIVQITNTAGTSTDALGNVGGQSVTKDNARYFKYACPEHGIIWCVATVRTNISYSSGVRKMYQRRDRFDYIWPEFRHIGDIPLYSREYYTDSENLMSDPDKVFGYTPYGSELREGYNFNNGLFRARASGSLSYLTYQEDFDFDNDHVPVLSAEWIEQPSDIFSNTLVDQNGPQFYGLFHITEYDVIPLDPDSDPMLMDHF